MTRTQLDVVNALAKQRDAHLWLTHPSPNMWDIVDVALAASIDWDDIAQLTDIAQEKKTRNAVVLQLQDACEKVIDGADFYVHGAASLYWMVRHYWLHAEDRSELGDGRALEHSSTRALERLSD